MIGNITHHWKNYIFLSGIASCRMISTKRGDFLEKTVPGFEGISLVSTVTLVRLMKSQSGLEIPLRGKVASMVIQEGKKNKGAIGKRQGDSVWRSVCFENLTL